MKNSIENIVKYIKFSSENSNSELLVSIPKIETNQVLNRNKLTQVGDLLNTVSNVFRNINKMGITIGDLQEKVSDIL